MTGSPAEAGRFERGAATMLGSGVSSVVGAILMAIDARRVLHIGCGGREPERLFPAFADWHEVTLDIDPRCQPDIVASMIDMGAVETASFDAIWCCHSLEHLEHYQIAPALAEFRRVLRPGGFALIAVPDLQCAAEAILSGKIEDPLYVSPAGPIAALDLVYGFRPSLKDGRSSMAHRTGFVAATLARHLQQAQFAETVVVRYPGRRELWAEARTKPGYPDLMQSLDFLVEQFARRLCA